MKKAQRHLSLLLLMLVPASTAFAQHQTFNVDPGASVVDFSLGGLHTVHGTFHVQSGSIDFAPGAAKISGSVVVAAGSGSSGEESRDRRMKADVLNAARFPVASFAPSIYQGAIAGAGDSAIRVTGTFTLHGTPHELTVPMQIHIEGSNCTAKTQFAVPYVKWGLKDPSNFILRVAKEVMIDLTLAGRLSTGF